MNQYTQGSMVTITVTTTNQLGHKVNPDNLKSPTIQVDFQSPNGLVTLISNKVMTPIDGQGYYYTTLDSTIFSIGSYVVTTSWIVASTLMYATDRFDILAFDGMTLLPVDPISHLRIRLKDHDQDPTRWVWSDQELSQYLNDALSNLNAMPPRNHFMWFNVPIIYIDTILLYAEYLAIKAQAFKLATQGVSYNDRNINVDKPRQAQFYWSMSQSLEQTASDKAKLLKRQYAYKFGYITTPGASSYLNVPPLRAWGRGWFL